MRFIFLMLCLLFSFLFYRCNTTGPTDDRFVSLEAVDASCTEVWLNVTLQNVPLPAKTILTRNDSLVGEFDLFSADTVIIDEGLNPSTNYSFKVSLADGSINSVSSIRTIDTTNRSFTWQTWEFGDYLGVQSSRLVDIEIIDKNNIWAVGEIYLRDTLGGSLSVGYNALHWNGSEWMIKRINYNGFFWVIKSLSVISNTDIWFSAFVKYDGQNFTDLPLTDQITGWAINNVFRLNKNNVVAVGNLVNIAHYNGTSWKKILSGTTIDLYDITSDSYGNIYIVGGDIARIEGVVLKQTGNVFEPIIWAKNISRQQLFNPHLGGSTIFCWHDKNRTLYVGGSHLYKFSAGRWSFDEKLEGNYFAGNTQAQHWGYLEDIKGINKNEIYLVGQRNTLRYFNGVRWTQIGEPYDPNSDIIWGSVDVQENYIVACGLKGNKAIIIKLEY